MSERERDFDIKRATLRRDCYREIREINRVSLARQEALRKELYWSKDEQAANVQVCKLRLERQIDALDREESGEEEIIGPIVNLPAELLGYIFHYHVDNDMSAWGLVKVCKYWKKVALYTPRLWRYISIAPALFTEPTNGAIAWTIDGKKQISKQNRQICPTNAQLQAALYRSGTVPLQVRAESMATTPNALASLAPLLTILICDPISSRIESLDLAEWPIQNLTHTLPETRPFGPFTHISSIAIWQQHHPWVQALFDSIESTAHGLEQLSLDRAEALAERSFWPHIKRLYLKGASDIRRFSDLAKKSLIQVLKISTSNDKEVIDVLEKAPNLRTIEVLSREEDETFGLEFLKRLDATHSHVLCPKLDSLSLGSLLDPIFTPMKAGHALIEQIVTSRKDIMAPLTNFSVSWHGNRYSVDNYAR